MLNTVGDDTRGSPLDEPNRIRRFWHVVSDRNQALRLIAGRILPMVAHHIEREVRAVFSVDLTHFRPQTRPRSFAPR